MLRRLLGVGMKGFGGTAGNSFLLVGGRTYSFTSARLPGRTCFHKSQVSGWYSDHMRLQPRPVRSTRSSSGGCPSIRRRGSRVSCVCLLRNTGLHSRAFRIRPQARVETHNSNQLIQHLAVSIHICFRVVWGVFFVGEMAYGVARRELVTNPWGCRGT